MRRGLLTRATLLGVGAGTAVAALAMVVVRLMLPHSHDALVGAVLAGLALGIAIGTGTARRIGARTAMPQLALWLEERVPELRWTLASAADDIGRGAAPSPVLERAVATVVFEPVLRGAVARALRWPAVFALLGVAALVVAHVVALPSVGTTAIAADAAARRDADDSAASAAAIAAGRSLADVTVSVTPPAYARRTAETRRGAGEMRALAGSVVLISGAQGGAPVSLAIDSAPSTPAERRDGRRWEARLTMPNRTLVVRLAAGAETRLLLLSLVPDSIPTLALLAPARDSVLRDGTGTLPLRATAGDDIGLASAAFEYIVSSGEGESFTFRSGTVGARTLGGARSAELGAELPLAPLELKAGDIVHLRAVAADANVVDGPGRGSSQTRTIRVARAGEYDTLAIEAAPPPEADKSVISQRMLIMMTEALVKSSPRIGRERTVAESQRIGDDQRALRKQVGDIVFARAGGESSAEHSHEGESPDAHSASAEAVAAGDSTARARARLLAEASAATGGGGDRALDFHGDETPVVAVNQPLLEAYNHMWDAGRALEGGRPAEALPPMRLALAAIQRARNAERVYLRGRPPAVVVDVDRVRLQGANMPTVIAPRTPSISEERALAARRSARFASAVSLLRSSPAAAADSLLMLRASVLGEGESGARLAVALGTALDDMRSGRDATAALVRARRALSSGGTAAPAPLGAWTGAW